MTHSLTLLTDWTRCKREPNALRLVAGKLVLQLRKIFEKKGL